MRLAIFGGTFDPIHKAHLAVGHAAVERFHLDLVLFVPAACPPHKSGVTYAGYEDRVHMTELACADEPRFKVSRLEENTERSYSIDTVGKVRARLSPEDQLFFLIGADAFAEINTWHRWREIVEAVTFIVVSRPGHVYQIPEGARVEHLEQLDLPISSSDIRDALARGLPVTEVPDPVLRYIIQHRLYNLPTGR